MAEIFDTVLCELCGSDAADNEIGIAYYRFWTQEQGWFSGPICTVCLSKLKGPVTPIRVITKEEQ